MKRISFLVAVFLATGTVASAQSSQTWHPVWKFSSSSVTCLNDEGRAELAKRAENGDSDAADILGTNYLTSCGNKQDIPKGMGLLERAAAKGSHHAQLALGEAYRIGTGGQADSRKAAVWFEKAAEGGNSQAQNNLGVIYQLGENKVAKDFPRSAQLLRSAAEQGLPEAEYNLAVVFDQGTGVPQSYELARAWYLKAAEHKDYAAEYRLGILSELGLGGDKDSAAAMRWYKKAAEDGSEEAQSQLGLKSPTDAQTIDSGYFQYVIGMKMLSGDGIGKNETQALIFLQKSTEAGYPPAMVQLASMFANGRGVKKDEAKAVEYCHSAIARDDKYHGGYNELAWVLLTADDGKLRNPQKALEYATKAVTLSDGKNAADLDTLAHAYFQTGDIAKALETETKAAAIAPEDEFIQKTLLEYKNAKGRP